MGRSGRRRAAEGGSRNRAAVDIASRDAELLEREAELLLEYA